MRVRSPWVWVAWLAAIVVSFIVLETIALRDENGLTLSQFTVNVTYAWLPAIFLMGMVVGILVAHFFWPWVPKQLRAQCGACGKTLLLRSPHDRG
jgi:hypothetical protein